MVPQGVCGEQTWVSLRPMEHPLFVKSSGVWRGSGQRENYAFISFFTMKQEGQQNNICEQEHICAGTNMF